MTAKKNERYCDISESIAESCKQVVLMRKGIMPKKSWSECRKDIQKMKEAKD